MDDPVISRELHCVCKGVHAFCLWFRIVLIIDIIARQILHLARLGR